MSDGPEHIGEIVRRVMTRAEAEAEARRRAERLRFSADPRTSAAELDAALRRMDERDRAAKQQELFA